MEPYAAADIKRKKRKDNFEKDYSEEDALKMYVYNTRFLRSEKRIGKTYDKKEIRDSP